MMTGCFCSASNKRSNGKNEFKEWRGFALSLRREAAGAKSKGGMGGGTIKASLSQGCVGKLLR